MATRQVWVVLVGVVKSLFAKAEISTADWSAVDKTKLPATCFLVVGDPTKKSTWKLPVYEGAGEIGEDGMYAKRGPLNANAVRAARAAIMGARTGEMMQGVPASAKAKLDDMMRMMQRTQKRWVSGLTKTASGHSSAKRWVELSKTCAAVTLDETDGNGISKADDDCDLIDVTFLPVEKAAADKQIVYGVVMEPGDPDTPDTQGDWMKAAEIETACHDFMRKYARQEAGIGEQHKRQAEADIVECFLAPADFEMGGQKVKKGSWVMGTYVADAEVWKRIKAGELSGYSIGGRGQRVEAPA